MSRLFLLDLDHTLFDTDQLKDHLYRQLHTVLTDAEQIEQLFVIERSLRYTPLYIHEAIKQFCEQFQLVEQRGEIYQAFLNIPFTDFVYPDVFESLEKLQKYGQLAIFSSGDELYQQVKVQQSRLNTAVQFIFIFDNKINQLQQVTSQFPNDEIWYVDNQLELLEHAAKIDEHIKTVWMRRKEFASESSFTPTTTVHSLTEFVQHIASI